MPRMPTRSQQPTPVQAQVELPSDFPAIPQSILDRFPEAADWQSRLDTFWQRSNQAIQQAQQQTANYNNSRVVYSVDTFQIYAKNGIPQPMFALDDTGVRIGNVLVINTAARKVYIGAGTYASDDTPFYIDTDGKFSLGANLTWEPGTAILTITGTIVATSGSIGGFNIGSNYMRDNGNSFGLSSVVSAGDDVRFWAGDTFANRATAPFRITESGAMNATIGTIGGFTIGATTLSAGAGSTSISISSTGIISIGAGSFLTTSISNSGIFISIASSDNITVTNSTITLVRHGLGTSSLTGLVLSLIDANLYRSSSNTLKTDSSLIISGTLYFDTSADTNLYRSAANTLKTDGNLILSSSTSDCFVLIDAPSTTKSSGINYSSSGSRKWSVGRGIADGSDDFIFYSDAAVAIVLRMTATRFTWVGDIVTGAPSIGAAGAWKLGKYTAGVVAQAGKVRVNIDSVDYDLLTA